MAGHIFCSAWQARCSKIDTKKNEANNLGDTATPIDVYWWRFFYSLYFSLSTTIRRSFFALCIQCDLICYVIILCGLCLCLQIQYTQKPWCSPTTVQPEKKEEKQPHISIAHTVISHDSWMLPNFCLGFCIESFSMIVVIFDWIMYAY